MNKISKNKKVLIPILIVALIVFIVGVTYAWLVWRGNGNETQIIKGGTLELELDETASNGISIDSVIPMSDAQGEATTAYTFTVRNRGTLSADYHIYLVDETLDNGEERIDDQYVKYSLTRSYGQQVKTTELLSVPTSTTTEGLKSRDIDSTTIGARVNNVDTVNTYTLKVWVDGSATNNQIAGKVFKAKIMIDATQGS